MIGIVKTAFLASAGTALLLGGGVAAFALSQDPDRLLIEAAERIKAQTGVTVQISPGAAWTIGLSPGIETGPVTVSHPSGAFWAKAKSAALDVDLLAVLLGGSVVDSVTLDGADIHVSSDAGPALSEASFPTGLGAASLALSNATLQIKGSRDGARDGAEDGATGKGARHEIAIARADLRYAGPSEPMMLTGEATWRTRAVTLDATLDSLDAMMRGEMAAFDLDLQIRPQAGGARDRLHYRGTIGLPRNGNLPFADGKAGLSVEDPGALLAWLGLTQTPLPLGALDATAQLKALPERLWLSLQSTATVQGHPASASATIGSGPAWQSGAPWNVDAVSRAGGLYSVYLSGVYDGAETLSGRLDAAILDPLDVSELVDLPSGRTALPWQHVGLQGDVFVRPDQIMLSNAKAVLDDHVLTATLIADMSGPDTVLALRDMDSGIGAVAAEVVIAKEGFLTGTVNGLDVNLSALAQGMNWPNVAGVLNGQARFRLARPAFDSADTSPLTAQAAFSVDDGLLPVRDLDQIRETDLKLTADPSGTKFKRLTGTLVIADDTARMADMALNLPSKAFTGVAEVSLASQTLSARLLPAAGEPVGPGILIGGPLLQPVARVEAFVPVIQPALERSTGPEASASPTIQAPNAERQPDPEPQQDRAEASPATPSATPASDPKARTRRYSNVPLPTPAPR